MDNFRERFDALERRTQMVEERLRWWRGIACGMLVLGLLSWALPLNQAPDASAAKKRHEDNDHKNNDVEERLAALEDKLAAVTFDMTNNEVVITGANLRIVNGLGDTETTNELGNLIVGYNEPRDFPGAINTRTGSHNLIVGVNHNFSSFGGLVVGFQNEISGAFASVSGSAGNTASGFTATVSGGRNNTASGVGTAICGGVLNTASGLTSSVSGGIGNTASGADSSVSGGRENTATGPESSSVSGGFRNTASGQFASVSGGANRTAPAQFNWAAGALFSDQ